MEKVQTVVYCTVLCLTHCRCRLVHVSKLGVAAGGGFSEAARLVSQACVVYCTNSFTTTITRTNASATNPLLEVTMLHYHSMDLAAIPHEVCIQDPGTPAVDHPARLPFPV